MRPNRKLIAAACCAAASLVLTLAPSTAAAKAHHHYPVHWNFLLNATAAGADGPNTSPPGSNLRCHPSAAHPRPVVLVHGLAADQADNWGALAPYLANHGYCVYSFTYGNNPSAPGFLDSIGGLADMTKSARVLARVVRHVRHVTHVKKVDLVGHSEGGTMPDWYLKFDHGSRYVDHFVVLSGLLHGTTVGVPTQLSSLLGVFGDTDASSSAASTWCLPCLDEFEPTSAWMKKLDTPYRTSTAKHAATCRVDGPAVDGINYTSIATKNDELVHPDNSDFIKPACANRKTRIGVHNILIQHQCPQDQSDHLSIAADPNVARDVLNALDPKHAKKVHCRSVLPSIG